MFGFINLNKPQGFTSHDCVAKTRRLLNIKKVGHGGTLDPKATGVLPIAVGKATRLLQFLPEKKAYRALIRLGMQTTTDDLEGEIVAIKKVTDLTQKEIVTYLHQFDGEIEQTPPIYSAIKQKGKKLYELARKGIEVEVPKRKVTIYSCDLIEIYKREFIEVEVDITCSEGTYIRAVARDLGKMLGVGGTLASLIRTKSCGLELSSSINFITLEKRIQDSTFDLIAPDKLLEHLPVVKLDALESKRWCHGQAISLYNNRSFYSLNVERSDYVRVYRENDLFLGIAILQSVEDKLFIKPKIVCVNFDN